MISANRIFSNMFKKHNTIRHVVSDGNSIQLNSYMSNGRCQWIVRAYTKNKDICRGCALKKHAICGNCYSPVPADGPYALGIHIKKVHEGDTLITESGKAYTVKRDFHTLFAEENR